jgi:galactoside O-acetyltransferase
VKEYCTVTKKKLKTVKRPFLGQLSDGGFKTNFWNYVERVTGKRSLSDFIRQGMILSLLSGLPSIFGTVLRGKVYRSIFGSVGKDCFIEKNTCFRVPRRIFLGDRVYIEENAFLTAPLPDGTIKLGNDVRIHRNTLVNPGIGKIVLHERVVVGPYSTLIGDGDIEIAKNSLLANMVQLITANHVFDDPLTPIRNQGVTIGRIEIGEDVWIGAHTLVLPGVEIGNRSVIGAGSIVTKDIPPYSVAVGAPARVIKRRGVKK